VPTDSDDLWSGDSPSIAPIAQASPADTPQTPADTPQPVWTPSVPSQGTAWTPAPSVWNYPPSPAPSPDPSTVAAAPTPNVTVTLPPAIQPGNGGPIYSSLFTGNTPFHHTAAELMAAGAQVLSPTIAANYWGEGIGSGIFGAQSGGAGPIYAVTNSDPSVTFSCPMYGPCNATGATVHYPAGATIQSGSDKHISVVNMTDQVETDGWLCTSLGRCANGGQFPFSGDGLAHGSSSGDAGGAAFGLHDITAQELIQGHIDHALGIEQSCLDSGGVYPAMVGKQTDAKCPSSLEPNAKYGYLIHIKSGVDVTKYGYGKYCTVIATAIQKFGAYTMDNNGEWGISLNVDAPQNPYADSGFAWFTIILPEMAAAGDARGSGVSYSWQSCLQRIPASDIEVIQISPNLPSAAAMVAQ
jgi:hypothetical protein